MPFSIALPENLPSSFFYCGDMLSRFAVIYTVTVNLIGLKQTGSAAPDGTMLYNISEVTSIRAQDPIAKPGIS